ncbi:hypothetical protein ACHAPT_009402 [Fusarium lateritium]
MLYKDTVGLIPAEKVQSVTLDDIDVASSHVATIYRLLTSFPDRFPEHVSDDPHQLWGHSHNNWQAAWVIFQAFKSRRTQDCPIKKNPKSVSATWYGFITDKEVVQSNTNLTLLEEDRRCLEDTSYEATLAGAGLNARQDELEELAQAPEFFKYKRHGFLQAATSVGSGVDILDDGVIEDEDNPDGEAAAATQMTRELTGTFLPNSTDLEAYQEIGIDTSAGVNWSEGRLMDDGAVAAIVLLCFNRHSSLRKHKFFLNQRPLASRREKFANLRSMAYLDVRSMAEVE